MENLMDKSSPIMDESNTQDSCIEAALSRNPVTWSETDVATWLNRCGLAQYVPVFQENEVDGTVLMDDDFDDTKIQELIPKMKYRLLFNKERKKLREKSSTTCESSENNVTEIPDKSVRTIKDNEEEPTVVLMHQKPHLSVRFGAKSCCKGASSKRSITRLNIDDLLQNWNCVHTVAVYNVFKKESSDVLTKIFEYLQAAPKTESLNPDFNIIVDEPINPEVLLQNISSFHSLKSYVLDSLKRYHGLSDVMNAFSSCCKFIESNGPTKDFLEIVEYITKHMLLTCTLESLSFESQRFFGNMIRKNGLPIPLAYYIFKNQNIEFKINFNALTETLCFHNERTILCLGSPETVGLGKTSVLSYLFENLRTDLLNTEGNPDLRLGCIDVLFATFTKHNPCAVFDVHGTMTTMNEDLITSIQHYCSVQIIFVTEADLRNKDFLLKTMNYSSETRSKPTVIVMFDPKYGGRTNNSTSFEVLQQGFNNENWKNISWITAPVFNMATSRSKFNEEQKQQRLRQSLMEIFDSLFINDQNQPNHESIFAIQAYFLTIKSAGSASTPLPPLYKMDIVEKLTALFNDMSDKTENLKLVTPISYLETTKLKLERTLSKLWEGSLAEIHKQLEDIKMEYQSIDRIPEYTSFFIDLLIKRSYIELLITERYLGQWRARYETSLNDQLKKAKHDAMAVMTHFKRLEEQCQQYSGNHNQDETENILNEKQIMKQHYQERQNRVLDIENQLTNIDLTIGLFCDEIFALYEHVPELFKGDNLVDLLAKKFAELMYKGFSFHILRGRPLRCSSKLIQLSLKYVHQLSSKAPFVLTVIGEQSSAKSSLMNTTFGCNFRVSAGRCTIGMYLSVVWWQSQAIVVLDTEGLLSLEESGSIFDNQMVSLAMLSSHLVLINHKGEFSSNLEHLVGMSFYAKLQIRSPLKPKLLFVLRDQSDTDSPEIFFGQLTKFKENLYNDSKFLKSSIDDELEIKEQNVILLPNAFSSDYNTALDVKQIWRNRTFPMEICKLRKMIFEIIDDANTHIYHDVSQLYQKIASNWDAIDKLGPNLLACKTLYELSMMNELRSISRAISEECIVAVNNEGQQNIEAILSSVIYEHCGDFDIAHLTDQFQTSMQNICEKTIQKGIADYHKKTERSCFPPDIKQKVEKFIEPPILNMQGLIREEFEDRLYKVRRDRRVLYAQRRLFDAVQQEFDRNISLDAQELETRVEKVYTGELEVCKKTMRSEFETQDQIITKILKFYNSDLSAKTANPTKGSIYNLLRPLDVRQYQEASQKLEKIYQCAMEYKELQHQHSKPSFFNSIKNFLTRNSSDNNAELIMWDSFYSKVEDWFHDKHYDEDNKKFLLNVIEKLLVPLRNDLINMVTTLLSSSSSNPQMITHIFSYIENLYNQEKVVRYRDRLNLPNFLLDIVVISIIILSEQIIKVEQSRHEKEVEKVLNEMVIWRESIKKQIHNMHDSFEQGKNMASIVSEEIFKEIGQLMVNKIIRDVTEDIGKSQFINHDTVQKQAYDESFNQGNGEKILKYVLGINRYFRELSLRDISTRLEALIHMHTQNTEQIIMNVFQTANDIVQRTNCDNVRSIADEIGREILRISLLEATVDNNFGLAEIMSVPIQDLPNFKRGFNILLDSLGDIRNQVSRMTQDVRKDAYYQCKLRISRRLGCQSRCPGCGSKCSLPEPHDEELVEQWHECKCSSGVCTCERPEPQLMKVHRTPHHIAEAFFGRNYYKQHTPVLKLCYQHWLKSGMYLANDELISPLKKFYNQHHPDWYNNLQDLSTTGNACNDDHPPPEQRRAWMIVRHVLVSRYASWDMVDNKDYDKTLYPSNIEALPKDFKPKWNDMDDEFNGRQ